MLNGKIEQYHDQKDDKIITSVIIKHSVNLKTTQLYVGNAVFLRSDFSKSYPMTVDALYIEDDAVVASCVRHDSNGVLHRSELAVTSLEVF